MTESSTTQTPPPGGPSVVDEQLERLRRSSIRRDTDRRWFGGVCAGIARRFDVDPLLIRAAAIVLTVAGGIGLPVYLVLWLLLPDARQVAWRTDGVRILSWQSGTTDLGTLATRLSVVSAVVSAIPRHVWQDHGYDPLRSPAR